LKKKSKNIVQKIEVIKRSDRPKVENNSNNTRSDTRKPFVRNNATSSNRPNNTNNSTANT
jgi:hypothetical protein